MLYRYRKAMNLSYEELEKTPYLVYMQDMEFMELEHAILKDGNS